MEINAVDVNAFQVSDEFFNVNKVLNQDPNQMNETEKNQFQFQTELKIDENWTPREGVYENKQVPSTQRQVVSGQRRLDLIRGDSKARYILHPLGSSWIPVNGTPGVILAATVLKEQTALFQDRVMDKLDYCVWQVFAFRTGLKHISSFVIRC
jgi:hypothetical protein